MDFFFLFLKEEEKKAIVFSTEIAGGLSLRLSTDDEADKWVQP